MVLAKGTCYYEVQDEKKKMIYNDIFDNCSIMTLEKGQSLKLQNGEVYEIDKVPYVPKKGEGYLQGMYKVGVHIPAGEYMAVGKTNFIDNYSDNSWDFKARIGLVDTNNCAIMTLEEGQYLEFHSEGELYPSDLAPKVKPADGVYKSGMYKGRKTYACENL